MSDDEAAASAKRKRDNKIEFKEDTIKRNTTFSKRKKGLIKKAEQLSVLTGADYLLVIAKNGKQYNFGGGCLAEYAKSDELKNRIRSLLPKSGRTSPQPTVPVPSTHHMQALFRPADLEAARQMHVAAGRYDMSAAALAYSTEPQRVYLEAPVASRPYTGDRTYPTVVEIDPTSLSRSYPVSSMPLPGLDHPFLSGGSQLPGGYLSNGLMYPPMTASSMQFTQQQQQQLQQLQQQQQQQHQQLQQQRQQQQAQSASGEAASLQHLTSAMQHQQQQQQQAVQHLQQAQQQPQPQQQPPQQPQHAPPANTLLSELATPRRVHELLSGGGGGGGVQQQMSSPSMIASPAAGSDANARPAAGSTA